jgi:sigma-B regulation protein RsbU (phosphoserine phosphatase)
MLNPGEREAFEEADLEVFEAYGNLAATAIDKLRTLERQREQERVGQEFAFAREIQTSFLPQSLPQRPELGFAATYRPARNVGGDFYDVVETGTDELYFVIGDVSGKGIPAALLMAQAQSILRLIIQPGITPDAAISRWNAMLTGHVIRGMFITALVGRILVAERRVEIASAGHCSPFRVNAEGAAEDVPLAGSPPLGILRELPCRCENVALSPGEWLVLFTDGLTECFDAEDCLLDRAGVAGLLAQRFRTATDVIDALNAGEIHHRGNAEPHDDLSALVFGFR